MSELANCVLQSLSSFEGWNLHSRDADLLRWVAWVHTHASCTLGNAERSEARDRYTVTLLELLRNGGDEGLECIGGSALGDAGRIRNRIDQILLRHRQGGKEVNRPIVEEEKTLPQAKNREKRS